MNRRSLAVSIVLLLIGVSVGWSLSTYAQSGTPEIKPSGISGFQWVNASNLKLTDDLYYGAYNRTPVIKYPEQVASYIIFIDGSTYYAKNGTTGQIDYSGTNFTTITQSVIDALGTDGGKVFIKQGILSPSILKPVPVPV